MTSEETMTSKQTFMEALREQRWDDHRLYHHSRINQSLHLFSACCFLTSYVLLAIDPVVAVLIGWLVAWVSRQIGHFFFEPHDYDDVNAMSQDEKESVKVGYNLFRKYVLLAAFLATPVILWKAPTLFGLTDGWVGRSEYLEHLSLLWFGVGVAALLFRTVQLFFVRDVQTGMVWFTKILTDPFNDIATYWKSPYHLFRGQLMDPMLEVEERSRANAA